MTQLATTNGCICEVPLKTSGSEGTPEWLLQATNARQATHAAIQRFTFKVIVLCPMTDARTWN
jgi:hypothetical protein